MRKIGWVVVAVAVVAVGYYSLLMMTGEDRGPRPQPGECAHIEGRPEAPQYRTTSCADDQANVKVAKVVDANAECPQGGAPYTKYTASHTLCLIPNFVEGNCYGRDKQAGLRKVDCTAAQSVRVVKVAHGTATTCEPDRAVAYPEPSVTFCLAKNGG